MNHLTIIIVAAFGLLNFVNVSPAEAGHNTIKDVGKVLVEDYRDKREHGQREESRDNEHGRRTETRDQNHDHNRERDDWRHRQREEHYKNRSGQRINERHESTNDRMRRESHHVDQRIRYENHRIGADQASSDIRVSEHRRITDPSSSSATAHDEAEARRFGWTPEETKAHRTSGVPTEEIRRNTAANYSGVRRSNNPYVLQGHLEPNVPSAQELKDRGFIRARGQFKTEVPAAQALPAPVELKPPVFRNDLTVGEAGEELLKIQKALEVLDSATPADIAASPKLRALRKYRSVYEARKAALIEALNSA